MLLGKDVSKASIAKILDVSRSALSTHPRRRLRPGPRPDGPASPAQPPVSDLNLVVAVSSPRPVRNQG